MYNIIMREGPNYFLVHYKNTSVLRQDPKDAWRVMGSAKFTPGSQQLKQWCLDIHEQYSKKKGETRKDSFASEAMVRGDLRERSERKYQDDHVASR